MKNTKRYNTASTSKEFLKTQPELFWKIALWKSDFRNFGEVMGVELLWSSLEKPKLCHQKYKLKLEISATTHYSPR